MIEAIPLDRAALAEFCKRWNVVELALFGSVLRDDFGPESDVDVLVSLDETARHTLFDLHQMEEELRSLFGRDVDLVSRPRRRAQPQSPAPPGDTGIGRDHL